MKKMLSLGLICLFLEVSAQELLRVEYDNYRTYDASKVEFQMQVNGVKLSKEQTMQHLNEQMKKPSVFELIVSKNESIYTAFQKLDNNNEGLKTTTVSISSKSGNGALYKNVNENYSLHVASGMGKDFLIKEDLKKYDWKMTRESKSIMGYEVKKATAIVDSVQVIEVWYAPSLVFVNGPDKYQGLPGLILEIKHRMNNDEELVIDYRVREIAIAKPKEKIEVPKNGKTVSIAEYSAEMEVLFKKRREMFDQGVDTKS